MIKKGINLEKNIALLAHNKVDDVCQPLRENFEMTYFNYVKLFRDGARATLTNNPEFINRYYTDENLYKTKAVISMEQSGKGSVHLYSEFRDQPSYIVCRNEYDIDNGITIVQPTQDKNIELFYFATNRKNYKNIYLYSSNVDMFYRFIVFFKEKARKLIEQAEKERFYIETPTITSQAADEILTRKRRFYLATQIKKLHLRVRNREVTLSRRELDCLYLTLQSMTAKEVAKFLAISPRTVETYLLQLKQKTVCETKNELIDMFTKPFYADVIEHAVNPDLLLCDE